MIISPSTLPVSANSYPRRNTRSNARRWLLPVVALIALIGETARAQNVVSSVDTSLNGSQKYVLRVEGQPYLLNAIQLRCDKLRYYSTYLWTMAQCNALAAQAASDGFNTITVPIMWYEVEPTKDTFDWTILNDYLAMANANNLKLELIWEGTNNDGSTEWEGDQKNPVHLRVPDYVLYAPKYGSSRTTSNYTIVSGKPYTLDMTDTNLQTRETYVLGKVMAQIAAWDTANESKHPVVGVQLNNEPQNFSDSVIVNYLSGIGSAIKSSSYSVWTRSNTVDTTSIVSSRIFVNNILRSGAGTNLDFIGIDNYSNTPSVIQSIMPAGSNNFAEVMENDGRNSADIRLAALAGNEALDTYDMCGPDGHGLYNEVGSGPTATFTPSGSNITAVRGVLHMLNTDPIDLALNANGQGLFVHNWQVTGTTTTGGTLSITYQPTSATDEGISILRNGTEIVLMSTGGGTFTYDPGLQVSSATSGYFDSNNLWVSQGNVSFTSTSVTAPAYGTVRLTYTLPAPQPPTGLAASSSSSGAASLNWNFAPYATSYHVKRSLTAGGPYTTIATVSTTSFADTGLTNGTTYYYVVSAVGSAGESQNSSEANVTPIAGPISIANYSFESPVLTAGTTSTFPTGAGWTFSGSGSPNDSGIASNGSSFVSGLASAPDGKQVAWLQEISSITQSLTGFQPGKTYTVTFYAAQRQSKTGGQAGQTFDVRIDGATIGSFAPPQASTTYGTYSASFTATATTHTVAFVATDLNTGDNTIFLDDVTIQ